MLKAFDEASSGIDASLEPSELDQQINRKIAELEQIVIEQTDVLGKIRKIEQKRLKKLFNQQEDILKNLAEKQDKVIEIAKKTRDALLNDNRFTYEVYRLNSDINKMEKVYEELKDAKIVKAVEYLEAIIDNLAQLKKAGEKHLIEKKQKEIMENINFMYYEEKDILETLKKPNDELNVKPEKSDADQMNNLGTLQDKLQGRTNKLNEDLQQISRKTAHLTPELFDNLNMASDAMGDASAYLKKNKSKPAEIEADKALDYLTKSRQQIMDSLEQMSQIQGQMAKPRPSFFSRQKSGSPIGPVPIPDKDDYIPPKEFREEILRSFKEKFPETYKRMVEEYYKRLSE
ncbi:MAG: DUF4175 family protein [bacterium]